MSDSPEGNTVERWRRIAIGVLLASAAIFFATVVSHHYRITSWLFWHYAFAAIVALTWLGCCMALGYKLLDLSTGTVLPLDEKFTLAIPLGVLCFGLAIFVLGLLHALSTFTFFALPLAFGIFGGKRLYADARHALVALPSGGLNWWKLPLICFGLLALGLVYFQILSPEAVTFDARWYHMPLAQQYALTGKIARFPEGFWPAAFPHLGSYLYAWGQLLPKSVLFDRMMLCAHMEFAIFLATLAQVPVLVRTLIGGKLVALSWVAFFLFPGIFLYDSNLNLGADHIAALWTIPIALSFRRAWTNLTPQTAGLFAAFLSASILTKYTTASVVITVGIAALLRAIYLCFKDRSKSVLLGSTTAVLGTFTLTAVHWLKNWVWYGDPVYPMFHKYLSVHPWHPDTPSFLKILEATGKPPTYDLEGLVHGLGAVFTFSFIPNDWIYFHRNVPVFGSLFTLLFFVLPFLKNTRKLWVLYGATMTAVFLWYMISHYDRYLQAVLPWMVACTAGVIVLIWRTAGRARVLVIPLVGLQVIWGGDVPFIATHNQIGDSTIRYVAKFLASGYEKKPNRLDLYEPLTTIGRSLPKDAVVLSHDIIMNLGIERPFVTDLHQSLFSYGRLRTPRKVHEQLTSLGVTHVVWPDWSIGRDSISGDFAVMNFFVNFTQDKRKFGSYNVAALPKDAPPDDGRDDYMIANFSCAGPYSQGWYQMSQMTLPAIGASQAPRPLKRLVAYKADDIAEADFAITDDRCRPPFPLEKPFALAVTRGNQQLFVKQIP